MDVLVTRYKLRKSHEYGEEMYRMASKLQIKGRSRERENSTRTCQHEAFARSVALHTNIETGSFPIVCAYRNDVFKNQ
jgi:hypothetical protein